MATCGEYELERAIGWGRRSTFFSARASGNGGSTLVVIRRARSVERSHRHAFLRAAAEQQTAVSAGCRKIAPILAFDCDEAGFAYYATTHFETSLAEFLEAGCKADGTLLREIVTNVLGGLAELQEKSRRAHGNLTPGNILLDPQGRIFLTDLAPSAKDATTADDLFALGTLIYQLVRRTTRIGTLNPPLDYSPAWTEAVGDDAEGWLAFTNRLLDKPRNGTPEAIQSALSDLRSLASLAAKAAKEAPKHSPLESGSTTTIPPVRRAPPKKRSPIPLILAAVLLLGGGGAGYYFYKKQEAEKERQKKIAEEAQRLKDVQKLLPGSIKPLAEELKSLPPEIINDRTAHSLLIRMGNAIGNATTPEGTVSEINSLILNWNLPGEMKKKATAWRDAPRAWTTLADALDAAATVDARSDTSIVTQFKTAITTSGDAITLERKWEDVASLLQSQMSAGNPMLPNFTPWAENEVRGAKDLTEASARAEAMLTVSRDVLAFQESMGKRVLWTRLEKEVPDVLQSPASPDLLRTWPTRWLAEARRFVAPEKAKIDEWKAKFADIAGRLERMQDPKVPEWKKKLADARAAAADALESQVATIDQTLVTFGSLQRPAEIAHDRYKAFLEKWQAKVKAITGTSPGAKLTAGALATEFKNTTADILAKFPEYKDSLGDIAGVADQMRQLLTTPDSMGKRFKAEGWSPQGDLGKDAAIFRYTQPGGGGALDMYFVAIDKDYAMSAWETPLVLARLSGQPAAALPIDRATGLLADGPQSRKFNEFAPAADWLWKGPSDLRKGPKDYFAPGVTGGDNDRFLPVTWLTYTDADKIAKALGGQLPTADQWKKAYAINENLKAGRPWRLRSETAWKKQYPLLKDWTREAGVLFAAPAAPDKGSFMITLPDYEKYRNAPETVAGDNKLWLTQVAGATPKWDQTKGFIHLVGNAAEWVNGENDPTRPPRPAIIGGSVVSPPTMPLDVAFSPNNPSAYFDVTFRLVIKLEPGGEGEGLRLFKEFVDGIQLPAAPAR